MDGFYTKEEFAKAGKIAQTHCWSDEELDDLIPITELVLEYVQNMYGFQLASTPIRTMLETYKSTKRLRELNKGK